MDVELEEGAHMKIHGRNRRVRTDTTTDIVNAVIIAAEIITKLEHVDNVNGIISHGLA